MGLGNHLQKNLAMPIRKQDYADNWPAISLSVREEAGQRCEWCGAPNKSIIKRCLKPDFIEPGLEEYKVDWIRIISILTVDGDENTELLSWARLKFYGLSKVILTVAHLDRNSHNNDRHNLAALCQRCHLKHDILQHIANRKYGRHHAKEQQLKLEI